VTGISRENLGLVFGLLGVVMFAGTLPAMRLAVAAIDPMFVTAARAVLAGVVALVFLIAMRRSLPSRGTWGKFVVTATCLIFGFPLLSASAMTTVPAVHASVIFGILPLATATAAVAFAGERPSVGFWIAGAIGTCSTVVFALRNGGFGPLVVGDLQLFASILTVAIGYAFAGQLSINVPGWEVMCWALVMALPLSVPIAIALLPSNIASVPLPALGGFIYVSLVSQLFAFFAWNAGLALGGIARVGQIQLLQTFLSIWLANLINHEAIDTGALLFSAIIVGTVVIGSRTRVARREPSNAASRPSDRNLHPLSLSETTGLGRSAPRPALGLQEEAADLPDRH
jgi:drug/metabolite transporter (DMT)-like permease